MQVVLIIALVIVVGVFAYIDAKFGIISSLPLLLRVMVPMLVSGIIVRIVMLIGLSETQMNLKYIISGVGTVIFYVVLANVFKRKEREYKSKKKAYEYIIGFFSGVLRGWLIFGFFLLYLNQFGGLFSKYPTLVNTILKPVHWLMFLDFIK